MAALLSIGLVNAAVATVLACLVALVARKAKRPALTHALWIIVLAKLITPPLIDVPIEVPFELPGMTVASDETSNAGVSTESPNCLLTKRARATLSPRPPAVVARRVKQA